MKRTNTWYWIITGLFALAMGFSAVPDMLSVPDAVDLVVTKLGYPAYILPFLGVAKLLGAITILLPGLPRLKEWAYAGLFFDLLGATWSALCTDDQPLHVLPMAVFFGLLFGSYALYHRRKKMSAAA